MCWYAIPMVTERRPHGYVVSCLCPVYKNNSRSQVCQIYHKNTYMDIKFQFDGKLFLYFYICLTDKTWIWIIIMSFSRIKELNQICGMLCAMRQGINSGTEVNSLSLDIKKLQWKLDQYGKCFFARECIPKCRQHYVGQWVSSVDSPVCRLC